MHDCAGGARGPLAQLQARYSLRRQRPDREAVDDEVEDALAAEAAQLSTITNQLALRAAAVEDQIKYERGAGQSHVSCNTAHNG